MRKELHHPTTAVRAVPLVDRSASAALPGTRMHTGGAGGRQHRMGTFPTLVQSAARGHASQLHLVRRGAPAHLSQPGCRLPSHPTPPVGNAGVKEENR